MPARAPVDGGTSVWPSAAEKSVKDVKGENEANAAASLFKRFDEDAYDPFGPEAGRLLHDIRDGLTDILEMHSLPELRSLCGVLRLEGGATRRGASRTPAEDAARRRALVVEHVRAAGRDAENRAAKVLRSVWEGILFEYLRAAGHPLRGVGLDPRHFVLRHWRRSLLEPGGGGASSSGGGGANSYGRIKASGGSGSGGGDDPSGGRAGDGGSFVGYYVQRRIRPRGPFASEDADVAAVRAAVGRREVAAKAAERTLRDGTDYRNVLEYLAAAGNLHAEAVRGVDYLSAEVETARARLDHSAESGLALQAQLLEAEDRLEAAAGALVHGAAADTVAARAMVGALAARDAGDQALSELARRMLASLNCLGDDDNGGEDKAVGGGGSADNDRDGCGGGSSGGVAGQDSSDASSGVEADREAACEAAAGVAADALGEGTASLEPPLVTANTGGKGAPSCVGSSSKSSSANENGGSSGSPGASPPPEDTAAKTATPWVWHVAVQPSHTAAAAAAAAEEDDTAVVFSSGNVRSASSVAGTKVTGSATAAAALSRPSKYGLAPLLLRVAEAQEQFVRRTRARLDGARACNRRLAVALAVERGELDPDDVDEDTTFEDGGGVDDFNSGIGGTDGGTGGGGIGSTSADGCDSGLWSPVRKPGLAMVTRQLAEVRERLAVRETELAATRAAWAAAQRASLVPLLPLLAGDDAPAVAAAAAALAAAGTDPDLYLYVLRTKEMQRAEAETRQYDKLLRAASSPGWPGGIKTRGLGTPGGRRNGKNGTPTSMRAGARGTPTDGGGAGAGSMSRGRSTAAGLNRAGSSIRRNPSIAESVTSVSSGRSGNEGGGASRGNPGSSGGGGSGSMTSQASNQKGAVRSSISAQPSALPPRPVSRPPPLRPMSGPPSPATVAPTSPAESSRRRQPSRSSAASAAPSQRPSTGSDRPSSSPSVAPRSSTTDRLSSLSSASVQ